MAGRTLEMPVTFRRPARYLNDGVPDFERDLALDGTALFASVKSSVLVDVRQRGSAVEEAAAGVRRRVRQRVAAWVGTHDPVSAAIVSAVLIGDRTVLSDEVRLRLQAAGTYHVIAISGGNIAILAALCVGFLRLLGTAGRPAAGSRSWSSQRTPARHVGRLGVARDADGLVVSSRRGFSINAVRRGTHSRSRRRSSPACGRSTCVTSGTS